MAAALRPITKLRTAEFVIFEEKLQLFSELQLLQHNCETSRSRMGAMFWALVVVFYGSEGLGNCVAKSCDSEKSCNFSSKIHYSAVRSFVIGRGAAAIDGGASESRDMLSVRCGPLVSTR